MSYARLFMYARIQTLVFQGHRRSQQRPDYSNSLNMTISILLTQTLARTVAMIVVASECVWRVIADMARVGSMASLCVLRDGVREVVVGLFVEELDKKSAPLIAGTPTPRASP
jgi:hypothetical protein